MRKSAGTGKRVAASRSRGRTARTGKFSANRKKFTKRTASVKRNATRIAKNTRQLKKLKNDSWGPYQTVTQKSGAFYVTEGDPAILHLNNFHDNRSHGPHWMKAQNPGYYTYQAENFTNLTDLTYETFPMQGSLAERDRLANHVPNGNKLMWRGIELKFEVDGFLDNTSVDIWVVQSKKAAGPIDHWNVQGLYNPSVLPYTVSQWREMSGFTSNRINHKHYKVWAHKRMFFNSRSSSSTLQAVQELADGGEQPTTPATTRSVKHCTIKLRPNMLIKQLAHSLGHNESSGDENANIDANPQSAVVGNYSWDNIDPYRNLWAIVTTDDQHVSIDGSEDRVRVQMYRRVWWQDEL